MQIKRTDEKRNAPTGWVQAARFNKELIVDELYHYEIGSTSSALFARNKLVPAQLGRYVAITVLRVLAPGRFGNLVTVTVDAWLTEAGM